MAAGVIEPLMAWEQLRSIMIDIVQNHMEQSDGRYLSGHRSLAYTAHVIGWRSGDKDMKDSLMELLHYQAKRANVNSGVLDNYAFLHHQANMKIMHETRAAVTMVLAMTPSARSAFIADLVCSRFVFKGSSIEILSRDALVAFEWECGLERTWCRGSNNGGNMCQIDLLEPDLACSINGTFVQRRLDHVSIEELSWFWNAVAGGLHRYAAGGRIARLMGNDPVVFSITPVVTVDSAPTIWRRIDVVLGSPWMSSAVPSRVRMYLRDDIIPRTSPADYFVQHDMDWFQNSYPVFKLPYIGLPKFHIWVSVQRGYAHQQHIIITDFEGKTVATIDMVIRNHIMEDSLDFICSGLALPGKPELVYLRDWTLLHKELELMDNSFDMKLFEDPKNISLFRQSIHNGDAASAPHRMIFQRVFIDGHPLTFKSALNSLGVVYWIWERSFPELRISRSQALAGFVPHFIPGVLLLEPTSGIAPEQHRRALILSDKRDIVATVDVRREHCPVTSGDRDVFVPGTRLDRLITVNRLVAATDYRQAFDLLRGVDLMSAPADVDVTALKSIIKSNAEDMNPMAVSLRALVLLIYNRIDDLYGEKDFKTEIGKKKLNARDVLDRYYQTYHNLPIEYRILTDSPTADDHVGLFLSRGEEVIMLQKMGSMVAPARLSWLMGSNHEAREHLAKVSLIVDNTDDKLVLAPTRQIRFILSDDIRKAWSATNFEKDAEINLDRALSTCAPFYPNRDPPGTYLILLGGAYYMKQTNTELAKRFWSFLRLRSIQNRKDTGYGYQHTIICRLFYERFSHVTGELELVGRDSLSVTAAIDRALCIPANMIHNWENWSDYAVDIAGLSLKSVMEFTPFAGFRSDVVGPLTLPPLPSCPASRMSLDALIGVMRQPLMQYDIELKALTSKHISSDDMVNDEEFKRTHDEHMEYYNGTMVSHDLLPSACRRYGQCDFPWRRAQTVLKEAKAGYKRIFDDTRTGYNWKESQSSTVMVDGLVKLKNSINTQMDKVLDVIMGVIFDSGRVLNNVGVGDDLAFRWQSLLPLLVQSSIDAYRARFPDISPNQIDTLHVAVFRMAILVTTSQQIDRALAVQGSLPAIAKELLQTRVDLDIILKRPAIVVFELMTNIRLRREQASDIDLMPTMAEDATTYPPIILQRLMAAGKTFVIGTLLALLKADGYHLSIMVPPASLFESNAQNMFKWSREFLGQQAQVVIFDRTDHYRRVGTLRALRETLINTIRLQRYVLMAPGTAHSIQNSYINAVDELNAAVHDQSTHVLKLRDEVHELSQILHILRERGVATLDEIDMTMDPKKEHNFAMGTRNHPKDTALDAIAHLYTFALTDKTIRLHVDLVGNQQALLAKEDYENHIRPLLIQHTIKSVCAQISNGRLWPKSMIKCDMATAFLSSASPRAGAPWAIDTAANGIDSVSASDHTLLDHVSLLHSVLYSQIPSAWASAVNLHYGRSRDPSIVLPKPFVAANTPSESSEFADAWEIVVRACQMYAVDGIDSAQTIKLLRNLYIAARTDLRTRVGAGIDDTVTAAKFNSVLHSTRKTNGDWCQTESITLAMIDTFNMTQIDCVRNRLRPSADSAEQHLALIMDFVRDHVLSEVAVSSEQIVGSPQNLVSMFHSVQGYSGTLENQYIFAHNAFVKSDAGANGQVLHRILRHNRHVHRIIAEADGSITVAALFQGVIDDAKKPFTALIDIGAIFKGVTNDQVALMILHQVEIIKRKANVADVFPIGVLFFDELSNSLRALLQRNAEDMPRRVEISGTDQQSIIAATGLESSDLFTYYDHRHITGTDITQVPTARALATVSATTTTLRDVLQGVMRMRKFLSTQSVEFAITIDKSASASTVDIATILQEAQMVQFEQERRQNRQAARQKMDNVVRDKLLGYLYGLSTRDKTVDGEQFAILRPMLFRPVILSKTNAVLASVSAQSTVKLLDDHAARLVNSIPSFLDDHLRSTVAAELKAIVERFPIRDDVSFGAFEDAFSSTVITEQQQTQIVEQVVEDTKEMLQDASLAHRYYRCQYLGQLARAIEDEPCVREGEVTAESLSLSIGKCFAQRKALDTRSIMTDVFIRRDYAALNGSSTPLIGTSLFDTRILVSDDYRRVFDGFAIRYIGMTGPPQLRKRPHEVLVRLAKDETGRVLQFDSVTLVSGQEVNTQVSNEKLLSISRLTGRVLFMSTTGMASPGRELPLRQEHTAAIFSRRARIPLVDVLIYAGAFGILDRPEWVPYFKLAVSMHPYKRVFLRDYWYKLETGIVLPDEKHLYQQSNVFALLQEDGDLAISDMDVSRFRDAMLQMGLSSNMTDRMIAEIRDAGDDDATATPYHVVDDDQEQDYSLYIVLIVVALISLIVLFCCCKSKLRSRCRPTKMDGSAVIATTVIAPDSSPESTPIDTVTAPVTSPESTPIDTVTVPVASPESTPIDTVTAPVASPESTPIDTVTEPDASVNDTTITTTH